MLSRYVGRLYAFKADIVKCGVHKCSTIIDATSREAVGKRTKVQVRRALYYETIYVPNDTMVQVMCKRRLTNVRTIGTFLRHLCRRLDIGDIWDITYYSIQKAPRT